MSPFSSFIFSDPANGALGNWNQKTRKTHFTLRVWSSWIFVMIIIGWMKLLQCAKLRRVAVRRETRAKLMSNLRLLRRAMQRGFGASKLQKQNDAREYYVDTGDADSTAVLREGRWLLVCITAVHYSLIYYSRNKIQLWLQPQFGQTGTWWKNSNNARVWNPRHETKKEIFVSGRSKTTKKYCIT